MMGQMLKRRGDKGTPWRLVTRLHLWRTSDTVRSCGGSGRTQTDGAFVFLAAGTPS